MQRATLEDVATLAGVSIKTVSRVVNREPNVSLSTMERVSKAIKSLNYQPNLSARNLASQRSHLIALVYDDPSTYQMASAGYILEMQEGALRACKNNHYDLLIHPCNYRSDNIKQELLSLVQQVRPDGIILAAPISGKSGVVKSLLATEIPIMLLSPGKKFSGSYSIATNDLEISSTMTLYLASIGHESIAFVAGNSSHRAVSNRLLGYKKALETLQRPLVKNFVFQGDNSVGSGEEAARNLLGLKSPPTAIFAANDDMAIGVMRQARILGLTIPDDLSIAGFDDITLARLVSPTLTTVRQPLAAMAERAAELIMDEKLRRECPELQIVPAELQIRESTRNPN
jgi:LacI family transcriptional regulator